MDQPAGMRMEAHHRLILGGYAPPTVSVGGLFVLQVEECKKRSMTGDTKSRVQEAVSQISPRDMRLCCQVRELLRELRVAPDDYLVTMAIVRRRYIQQMGLKRYLADTLGHYGGKLASNCVAYEASGRKIDCNPGRRGENGTSATLLEFLTTFTADTLPYRIELQHEGKTINLAL